MRGNNTHFWNIIIKLSNLRKNVRLKVLSLSLTSKALSESLLTVFHPSFKRISTVFVDEQEGE